MNSTKNIEKRLQELNDLISKLPNGYISKKIINGKVKNYLQWQESGKKKSKYISDNEINSLEEKINERRLLQEEMQTLKKELSKKTKNSEAHIFKTNVIIGDALSRYITPIINYKKRDCYLKLKEYLQGTSFGKVFILYGLRRTGKTTLIKQAILDMSEEDRKKCAFIQINSNNSLADVNDDLKFLESLGYKYVFIDEATLMNDFIDGAALFSDIFASSGMKIILSGKDSLGFLLAEDDQLYDRCFMLHTTFISYKEFERVLGIKGVDEYICYGGTMSISGANYNDSSTFANEKSTNEYVNSAIAINIQHSLKCYQNEGHFRHLIDLYNNNELTNVINRVVEDMNHRFTLEVLTKEFKSNDLGVSQRNIRNDKLNGSDILDRIDNEKVTKRLKELLEIKNKNEQNVEISNCHRIEIKEYLKLLDLIFDIPIETIPVGEREYRTIFTQPGMRYSIAEALIKSLLKDQKFQDISISERNHVISRTLNEIKGRMLEDIILLETKYASNKKEVFKLQFAIGEFDMVVFDEENSTCEIYEIKHSDKIIDKQYKNLIDSEKCANTEFRYGKIVNKYVIYRGENVVLENGIKYLNVEDYLKNL